MIVFDLRCGSAHVFEAWFGSTADYDAQRTRGLIACPLCGDTGVGKAVMAPAVAAKGNRRDDASGRRAVASQGEDSPKAARAGDPGLATLLALQRAMEARSDYVGGNFATEARAMHEGSVPERSIYGEASASEVRALADDGVPLLPLPFTPLVRSDA
jgi:hypothetical protein